jgi:Flp pilus assembly protein TadD
LGALGSVVVLLLAGCAGQGGSDLLAAVPPGGAPDATQSTAPPTATASLAEAKSLELTGDRKKAYSAAALALSAEPANPDVVVTYSRLAVGLGRTEEAEKALTSAEASGLKDWRILSAKGAVLAEKGDLDGAKATLQRGLELAPEQPALLNNLAFVYTLEGNPRMAEDLLRRASAGSDAKPRTRQNLALVLGLQGKYDESKKVGAAVSSREVAEANVAYLKKLTEAKLETKLAQAAN